LALFDCSLEKITQFQERSHTSCKVVLKIKDKLNKLMKVPLSPDGNK
jgi:hypothetical protein